RNRTGADGDVAGKSPAFRPAGRRFQDRMCPLGGCAAPASAFAGFVPTSPYRSLSTFLLEAFYPGIKLWQEMLSADGVGKSVADDLDQLCFRQSHLLCIQNQFLCHRAGIRRVIRTDGDRH
ncbi:Manganese transport regulator, partial [Dysosmobacter welbionis]